MPSKHQWAASSQIYISTLKNVALLCQYDNLKFLLKKNSVFSELLRIEDQKHDYFGALLILEVWRFTLQTIHLAYAIKCKKFSFKPRFLIKNKTLCN